LDRVLDLNAKFDQKAAHFAASWRELPRWTRILVKLHSLLLVVVGLSHGVNQNVVLHQGYETSAFAVPASSHQRVPWQTEVDAFGRKMARAFQVRETTANEFAGWILEASRRQDLEPELLASLVLTESSFRKHARSPAGAVGPAQVRPEYWRSFCGVKDLSDPAENIYCGAQILAYKADRCGGEKCALGAYNIGFNSQRHHAARRYVAKVDHYRDQLRNYPL
tara:strand:- start:328 stop:993 length:666 start_codon:yes stop_codon:yes gene_type:complete